jgi:hypothetical protein
MHITSVRAHASQVFDGIFKGYVCLMGFGMMFDDQNWNFGVFMNGMGSPAKFSKGLVIQNGW